MDPLSRSPARPFLGRYAQPLPIRSRGAFELVSARRLDGDVPCVLVLPGAAAAPDRVREAFADVEWAHARIEHPRVPKVAFRGDLEGTPVLELACDAVADAIEVLGLVAADGEKLPYAEADAFITGLRTAMEAAHLVVDPKRGGPLCLGRVSLGNVLANPAGEWFVVGFGRNFPLENDTGGVDGTVAFFQAPELAVGGAPTPAGDYVALLHFMRSLMQYTDMSVLLGILLHDAPTPKDLELLGHLQWMDQRMLGAVPGTRATLAEAVAVAGEIRRLAGVTLDDAGLARRIARLLAEADHSPAPEAAVAAKAHRLLVGPEAAWIVVPDGSRHRLGPASRRLVVALIERQRTAPGSPMTMWDLLDAGWPGEKPLAAAGANRVYVTLNRLRNAGLRELIERFDEGYRLAPDVVVTQEGQP